MTAETVSLRVILWTRLALMKPKKSGYYAVRDRECHEGVAFMHPNGTWTPVSGPAQKPYGDWRDIE